MLSPSSRQTQNIGIGAIVALLTLGILCLLDGWMASTGNTDVALPLLCLLVALGAAVATYVQDAWGIFSPASSSLGGKAKSTDGEQAEYLKRYVHYWREVVMAGMFGAFFAAFLAFSYHTFVRMDIAMGDGMKYVFAQAFIVAVAYWLGTSAGRFAKGRVMSWKWNRDTRAELEKGND